MTDHDTLRPDRDEVAKRFEELEGRWWHSIDVGHGLVTQGHKTPERLQQEWDSMGITDLTGKTVLDIGAWDGYFSFKAEDAGASAVTSLDHYVWSLDPFECQAYAKRERDAGRKPKPYDQVPELWRPEDLPGKRSYDFAKWARGSKVQDRVGDLMELDPQDLGSFDVVFYLGVLYHVKDPVGAIERLARITDEMAVIETEAVSIAGHDPQPLWYFIADDHINDDPTNWWIPTPSAIDDLCVAAGFSRTETTLAPGYEAPSAFKAGSVVKRLAKAALGRPPYDVDAASRVHRFRTVTRAYK